MTIKLEKETIEYKENKQRQITYTITTNEKIHMCKDKEKIKIQKIKKLILVMIYLNHYFYQT